MRELQNIYSGAEPSCANNLCDGCSILNQSKPQYSYMDYPKLNEGPVLFLSDSFRHKYGTLEPFSKRERVLIKKLYPGKLQFSAAVKCPTVKEADMTPANLVLCRAHL